MSLNVSDFTLPEWKEVSKYDSSISTFVRLSYKGSSKIIMPPVISRILELCDFSYHGMLKCLIEHVIELLKPLAQ